MPIASITAYLERLPARQAELKLLLSDTVSIPHMKENARKQTLSGWMRVAQVFYSENARPASAARLRLMGIGVGHVRSSKPGAGNP
jgi:hypothetical protein